ncbi:hypothetical protein LLF64_16030 [Escherichia coli]|nr:hypothetical protein [Escherichia coli]
MDSKVHAETIQVKLCNAKIYLTHKLIFMSRNFDSQQTNQQEALKRMIASQEGVFIVDNDTK